jgi:hypothetical protein
MKDPTNELLIKAGVKTKNYFEFQAESSDNIIEFYNTIKKHSDSLIFIWKFAFFRNCFFPEVECELTVSLSFDEVINIMKKQEDSHLMIRTLKLINQERLTEDSKVKFTTQNLIDQGDDLGN